MLRLTRDHAIPAVPVHDSLIVPQEAGWVANASLQQEFTKAVGKKPPMFSFTPPITHLPPPHRTRFAHLFDSLTHQGQRQQPREVEAENGYF